jgi:hypothetical protein
VQAGSIQYYPISGFDHAHNITFQKQNNKNKIKIKKDDMTS